MTVHSKHADHSEGAGSFPRLASLLLRTRAPTRFANVVFRFGDAHDPFIKPPHDVLQPLDTMPRLTGARQLVRLIRETHHHRRYLSIFQCPEHLLTTRPAWRPPVGLAQYQHQRRLDLVDISGRRSSSIIFRIFKRRRLEPRRLEKRE